MKNKSFMYAILSIAIIAGGTSLVAPVAQAGVNLNLELGIPPPEPRYEPVPVARDGFIWIQGFWGWDGNRHVWHEGRWEHERRGYAYRPEHWERVGDHWRFREGGWEQHKVARHEERRDHDHADR